MKKEKEENEKRFLHFHIIPTLFCPESCPYCINSSDEIKEISFEDYKNFLLLLKEILLNPKIKLILEFNGGEFTLSKNLYKYFEILKKFKILNKLEYLILTTNFNSSNEKYKKILKILKGSQRDPFSFNLQFFVTFHYNKDLKFINKIKNFLKDTKEYNYEFIINKITG